MSRCLQSQEGINDRSAVHSACCNLIVLHFSSFKNRSLVGRLRLSQGFSGTNGHGLMEAILTQPSEPKVVKPMRFARKVLKPWREWMQKVVYFEEWVKADYSMSSPLDGKLLLVTDGDAMAGSLTSAMPSKPVAVTEVGTAADIGEKMKRAGTAAAVFARCLESGRAEPLPGSHLEELVAFLQGAILAELPKLLVVVTRGAYDAKREKLRCGRLDLGLDPLGENGDASCYDQDCGCCSRCKSRRYREGHCSRVAGTRWRR